MILGIDIGGTHTDAVCLSGRSILATAKTPTGEDLVDSILDVIAKLGIDYSKLKRVVLSTTLSTNAIVEKKYAPTGMIVSAGPGIDPCNYFLTDEFLLVRGAIDHRGREYVPIDKHEVLDTAKCLKTRGIQGVGIVSKFSVRNALHETSIADLIKDDFRYLSMGHTMSGSLNFPRRLRTTYFNSAVMPVQERFVGSVQKALARLGIQVPLFFLKADGGTYASSAAGRLPVETILSGPAASMMGALALNARFSGATVVLDIGGTTTDIGLLVDGLPIFEPSGVDIGGVRTLVRGLKVVSVGAGGDSCVQQAADALCVGPHRSGPPACMGGKYPTPMDAFAVLGEFTLGDTQKALDALMPIAEKRGKDIGSLCKEIISIMVENIKKKVFEFIEKVNSQPVYTIFEMLHPELIKPDQVILIGGPAHLLKPYIEESFGMKCEVPEHAMVANALGAALARTTAQITLLADTQMRKIICPELCLEMESSSSMSISDLKTIGIKALRDHAQLLGLHEEIEVSIIEEQSFSMVRGFNTVGKNMRIKIQTSPGILSQWRDK
jgi:N-methylhydantoinase A/oxoprolinase/acetone carboxylase beta subunit